MALTLQNRLFTEYPLPKQASIWGNPQLADLNDLIESSLSDLQSDLEIYESVYLSQVETSAPEGTRCVSSTKLAQPFQGNRFVKADFNPYNNTIICNYYPAICTIKRNVTLDDILGNTKKPLEGSRMQYVKAFILEKMASKEISYLTSIKLNSDIGDIDLTALEEFRKGCEGLVKELKEDIMLYSST